ncbi:MAG: M20/M25/M40 family metallo-hydrolase [Bacteroidia bacterium]
MRYFIFYILFLYFGAAAQETSQKAVLHTLSEVMTYRSVSGNERALQKHLLQKCKDMGFYMYEFIDKDSAINFSASVYPLESAKPNIVFLCHTDVVPAPDSAQWRYHPFAGKIVNDTIWGRGILDMKGIGVMELFAMQAFLDSAKKVDMPYNLTLLFVSDEETGGVHGAKFIVENHLQTLKPKLVIGEGGGGFKKLLPSKPGKLVFFVSVAEKKSLWLKLSVHHHSGGHGAMSSKETANSILLKAIAKVEEKKPIIIFDRTTKRMFKELGKLNGGLKGFVLKNINKFWMYPVRRRILRSQPMLLGEVTSSAQLTNIYNPQQPPNVIPNEAAAYFDCRLLPGIHTKKYIRRLKLKILNPKVRIEIVDQSATAPPTRPGKTFSIIEKSLQKTYKGSDAMPVLFPATTDNSFFRSVRIDSYGILPLELSQDLIRNVHGTNECMPVPVFMKGIEAYRNLMRDLLRDK